jgi:hypothetical protein
MSKLEESIHGNTVFRDDIENSVYKKLVVIIKDLKKPVSKK